MYLPKMRKIKTKYSLWYLIIVVVQWPITQQTNIRMIINGPFTIRSGSHWHYAQPSVRIFIKCNRKTILNITYWTHRLRKHITTRFSGPDNCNILCTRWATGQRFSISLSGWLVRKNCKCVDESRMIILNIWTVYRNPQPI